MRFEARCDGMAVFECPPLREYAELWNDPSGCEVRKDKVEARAKTRRSYDRVGTGTGRQSGWGGTRCPLATPRPPSLSHGSSCDRSSSTPSPSARRARRESPKSSISWSRAPAPRRLDGGRGACDAAPTPRDGLDPFHTTIASGPSQFSWTNRLPSLPFQPPGLCARGR